MLVDGKIDSEPSQETLTCAQVIMYNAVKKKPDHSVASYKDKRRETLSYDVQHS